MGFNGSLAPKLDACAFMHFSGERVPGFHRTLRLLPDYKKRQQG